MGTTFDYIIEDHCLVMADDYKIKTLWDKTHAESPATPEWPIEKWNGYVDGFLKIAINRFKPYCDNLDYENREFVSELSEMEIQMLTLYWIIAWAKREVNNSSQIQLKLKTSSGFAFSSEGSTLKAKQQWLDIMEEEANRILTQYELSEGKIGSYNW